MKVSLAQNKIAIQLQNGDNFIDVINKIKKHLSPYTYDPTAKLWITEKMNLLIFEQVFINEKIYYDKDVLELIEKQKKYIEKLNGDKKTEYNNKIDLVKEDVNFYIHQKQGINYMLKNYPCGLFDEQGLGKSLTSISVLCELFKNQTIDNCVIICPNTLKYNWQKEIAQFSSLDCKILEGDKKEKLESLLEHHKIYITNYESLIVREGEKIKKETQELNKKFQKEFAHLITGKTCIILDEVHRIKSGSSSTSKVLRKLGKQTKYKFILSGTPIANKPEDIFYQFMFLDEGKLLGTNYWEFLKQYCFLGDRFSRFSIVGYKNLDKLKFLIELKSIRRLKDDVLDLPQKIYEEKIIETSKEHLVFYNKLKEEILQIIKLDGSIQNIKSCLIRLIQAASNPLLIDLNSKINSSKISELDNLLNEHIDRSGNKVVIWTNFINNFPFLLNRYKKYNPVYINGSVSPEQRQKYVNEFQNDDNIKIIICNPQAAKEGITLTSSNMSIYLDRTFNLVDWKQSNDRIHRIGQNKRCLIVSLVCKDTIDEIISKNIYKKSSMAAYLQGDVESIEKYSENKMLEDCVKQLSLIID